MTMFASVDEEGKGCLGGAAADGVGHVNVYY